MATRTIMIRRIRRNLPHERLLRDCHNPIDWMDEDELYKWFRFRR